jgi:flagellar biosynthetic protein FliQ
MDHEYVVQITNQAIKVSMMLAAPMLIGALVIGVLISIFQAVTQINEQTLSFIPKVIVIVISIVIFSPWMMETLTTFTREIFLAIPEVVVGQ